MKSFFLCIVFLLCARLLFAQLYLSQNFEDGLGQWQAISMSADNDSEFGIVTDASESHGGSR